jgi:anti-sigma-K factor RskA
MSEQNDPDGPTLDALALGVDPVEPPPDLRERILDAARAGAEVVPMPAPPPPRPARFRIPLGAVAAMVVVALGVGLIAGDAIGHIGVQQPGPLTQSPRFTLEGHGPMASVSATGVDVKSEGFVLVSFSGLPQLPPSKVYQLWLVTPANHADSAGVFVPDANGEKVLVVDHSLTGYKLMAVTVEDGPAGAPAPTQQPQIYGTVT